MIRVAGTVVAFVLVAVAIAGLPGSDHAAVAAGCWPGKAHGPGTTVETISITGQGQRSYRLHVPPSYNGADRTALVLSFHGLTSNGLEQEVYSGLSTFSDAGAGFIAVYPEGLVNGSGDQYWSFHPQIPPNDVLFTSELLDELEADLCIDTNNVFSTGISNGAIMSSRLACSLSSRIAAIAPVAGAYFPPLLSNLPEDCPDTRAVPFISFHGTDDDTIPYNGGGGQPDFRLPQDNATPDEDVTEDWAIHNGCTSGRSETQIDTEVRLIAYTGCTDGATVQHYAVDGGGHTWPGSFDVPGLGYTTQQISATELMWEFFEAHPLSVQVEPDTDGDEIPDAVDPDNDNDGCTDEQETGLSAQDGGLRNAKSHWDYFNPSQDKMNRVGDIVMVLQAYFVDDDDANPGLPPYEPGYNPNLDRTLVGPNLWDTGPPNGLQRVDDIVNILNQYFHDCA
jgi:polyhydroxybutyrate depolymerase